MLTHKFSKHKNLNRKNIITPNYFISITTKMNKKEIFNYLLIKNITILEFLFGLSRK